MLVRGLKAWKMFCGSLGIVAILSYGWIPPRTTGIHCYDQTIAHKFTKDTFSFRLLVLLSLIPMAGLLFLGEYIHLKSKQLTGTRLRSESWSQAKLILSDFVSFSCISLLFNEIIKTFVAEPRPHFLDTCGLDWNQLGCHDNPSKYIELDLKMCQVIDNPKNKMPNPIVDATRSFPSGHAQLAFYVTTFAMIYVNKRFYSTPTTKSDLLAICIKLFYIIFALFASISRITDRRHHWWDVLFGAILGTISARLTVTYQLDNLDESIFCARDNETKRAKKPS